ncbi:MAG: hypothetical protein LIO94_05455, partial [Clostridiales bacterium]|nr:hypothetical protein [Clostridiales bacterium]
VLLYGKKTISRWGFRRSVLETIRRNVSHVILQRCAGDDQMTDDGACAQLTEAAELLTEHGFHEYLPCRWAKDGSEDRFWTEVKAGTDVLAFGLGAQTKVDGVISRNTQDLQTYLQYSGQYQKITLSVTPADTFS